MFDATMCWAIVFHIHNLPFIWNYALWTYNCKLTFMFTYAFWKIQTLMMDKINACMQIWSNHCKTAGSWCTKICSKHICQLKVFTWYSSIQITQAIIFTFEKCEDTTHEMNTTIFASKCFTFSCTRSDLMVLLLHCHSLDGLACWLCLEDTWLPGGSADIIASVCGWLVLLLHDKKWKAFNSFGM